MASLLVVVIGGLGLASWSLNIEILRTLAPALPEMKANTAVMFVLCGVSLGLLQSGQAWRQQIGRACAWVPGIVGAVTLIQYGFGWNFGIDEILFTDPSMVATPYAGRMAPQTALGFVVSFLALIQFRTAGQSSRRSSSEVMAVAAGLIGLLSLLGHLYRIGVLYRVAAGNGVSVPTALGFLILSAGLLSMQQYGPMISVMVSETAGGLMVRRILPVAVIVTFAITWMSALLEHGGFEPFTTMSVIGSIYVALVVTLISWNGRLLHRIDSERSMAEEGRRKEQELAAERQAAAWVAEANQQRYHSLAEAFQKLSRELIQAQETERAHLARELHDEIGQNLTALRINLEILRQTNPYGGPQIEDSFVIVERLFGQIRDLSRGLHPALLDEAGLEVAVRSFLKEQSDRFGLQIDFRSALWDKTLQPDQDLALFRIVQEAITNVVRHAGAQLVLVTLFRNNENEIELTIHDNGTGFDPDSVEMSKSAGLGIIGMQERAALLGGTFAIRSTANFGTAISVRIPSNRPETKRKDRRHTPIS